ncbi:MAG: DNA repair protein RecO [Patescibacteria group bacterium]
MEYFTQAIVLNKKDSKENDRLFSLYTKNLGKTTGLARGVKKIQSKMAGQLEPFALLNIKLVTSRGINRISNVETLNRYVNIISDYQTIKLANQCLRLVDDLVKEGSCDLGILKLLNQILAILDDPNKQSAQKEFLTRIFSWQILAHLGYRPELYQCVICRQKIEPVGNRFNFLRGGLICAEEDREEPEIEVSENQIKVLRLILEQDLEFFIKNRFNSQLTIGVNELMSEFVVAIRC